MKLLVVEGCFALLSHFKSPFAYQTNTTMPVPYPSTLLGALARPYLQLKQYGELHLTDSTMKKKRKNPASPTALLKDSICAAYYRLLTESGRIPMATVIQQHVIAKSRDASSAKKVSVTGDTDIRGKEFLIQSDAKARLYYIIDDDKLDVKDIKLAAYKIQYIGAAESLFEVESVEEHDLDPSKGTLERGKIAVPFTDDAAKLEQGNTLLYKIDHSKAYYPKWQSKSSVLYVPGSYSDFYYLDVVEVSTKEGWTLYETEMGDLLPIKEFQ